MSLFEPRDEVATTFQPLDLLAPGRRDTVEKIEREIVADEEGCGPQFGHRWPPVGPGLLTGLHKCVTCILAIDKLLAGYGFITSLHLIRRLLTQASRHANWKRTSPCPL